jgi:acetyl-CoA C-acetyltransferase/acetyl-CoA acyltransferase 2
VPERVPALVVNRLCGSGFEALIHAAMLLQAGEAEVVLAGGTESMSQAPLVLRGTRWGFPLGKPPPMEDVLWSALTDTYAGLPMALTAEKLAERHRIGQDEVDELSLLSQRRWAAADEAGRFREELAPLEVKTRKGPVLFGRDEHPRPDTTLDKLAKLPTPFRQGGTITAGNASGINDGAAALLVASEAACARFGLEPLARVIGGAAAGVPPRIMGIGPAPATTKLCARLGWRIDEVDVVELNEAFASQALATLRELGLPDDASHVNPNGGAIALGHPLGMSGARISGTAALELKERGVRRALATMCIGVGQGIAVALEAA